MTTRSITAAMWLLAVTTLAADLMVIAAYPTLERLTMLNHFNYSQCTWIAPSLSVDLDDRAMFKERIRTPEGRYCVR